MPILEYQCEEGHRFERLFLTFAKAAKARKQVCCDVCFTSVAERIEFSVPGQAILYGDGFHKPAASGKLQTRGRDVTKVVAEENINVTTQDGSKFGVGHMEKAKAISKQIRRGKRQ